MNNSSPPGSSAVVFRTVPYGLTVPPDRIFMSSRHPFLGLFVLGALLLLLSPIVSSDSPMSYKDPEFPREEEVEALLQPLSDKMQDQTYFSDVSNRNAAKKTVEDILKNYPEHIGVV